MNAESPPPSLPETALGKTSGMAVTSLVLGILGIATCGITAVLSAPIGLILGIVAMIKIGKSEGQLKGNGLALAGVIMSGMTIVLIPIFLAMMLPALAAAKQKAFEIQCINNEKQLAMAMLVYSSSHENHLPAAATWCDDIKDKVVNPQITFKCLAANSSSRCDYAFNSKLDGIAVSSIHHPGETVLIFESDGGWNASGGPELFPSHARHGHGSSQLFIVAFTDGHVEEVTPARLGSLDWDPNQ